MNRTRSWTASLSVPALIAAAAAGGGDERPATENLAAPVEVEDFGTVRTGFIPILGFAPIFVAVEKGYFDEQGLDVELQSFRSGDPMIAPLGAGQLDVGGGETGPALLNAFNQDFDVRVVAGLASQPPGLGAVPLLVRQDLIDNGEVASVADLAGRTVALNVQRGQAEYLLNKALEQDGLSIDDVQVTTIPFPEHPQALANAAVDAAVLPHPLAAQAIGEGFAAVLVDGDQITDNPQNGVIYFGVRMLEPENHEVGVRFLVAYLRGARDLYGDGWRAEENVAAIHEFTEVPEPAIQSGVPYFFEPDGVINRESMQDIADYHIGRGYTDLEGTLSVDELIVEEFLAEALDRLGAFEAPEGPAETEATEETEAIEGT